MSIQKIELITKREELLSYVKTVSEMADDHRHAFSFFSDTVYEDAALGERLIVAINPDDKSYCGHIFFGGSGHTGRVRQILVAPHLRRRGVAGILFDRLYQIMNMRGYTELVARVYSHLTDANALYEAMGFKQIRQVDAKTPNRKINLRVKDLDSPNLFQHTSLPPITNQVVIPERTTSRPPTYLLDLNVVLDLLRKRPSSVSSGLVMRKSMERYIQVGITKEIQAELLRNSKDPDNDPAIKFSDHFSVFNSPQTDTDKVLKNEIAQIVFPENFSQNRLTKQDVSDLAHLVSAIENKVDGFVTNDQKILKAADYFSKEFFLEIVSPQELEIRLDEADDFHLHTFSNQIADNFTAHYTNTKQDREVSDAIATLGIKPHCIPSQGQKTQFIIVTGRNDNKAKGLLWWSKIVGASTQVDAFIHVDDTSDYCEVIVDFLCDKLVKTNCSNGISKFSLLSNPKAVMVRNVILEHGFRAASGDHTIDKTLQKIGVGEPLHSGNWSQVRLQIDHATDGLRLPKEIPTEFNPDSYVDIKGHDGQTRRISIQHLEQQLSPTFFVTNDRDGVIVSILRGWADDLFGTHPQQNLLQPPEAIVRRERAYFSHKKNIHELQSGKIILFYETGKKKGRMELITVARITQSILMDIQEIENNLLKRGVLDKKMLEKLDPTGKYTVTYFDNVMTLRKPIPYKQLQEMGCDTKNMNFQAPTPISAELLSSVLNEGQPHVTA